MGAQCAHRTPGGTVEEPYPYQIKEPTVDRTTTSQSHRSTLIRSTSTARALQRTAAVAMIASLGVGVGVGPASARPDPGDVAVAGRASIAAAAISGVPDPAGLRCALGRIGTQYVRCDNLTGAGAKAPAWVPELI